MWGFLVPCIYICVYIYAYIDITCVIHMQGFRFRYTHVITLCSSGHLYVEMHIFVGFWVIRRYVTGLGQAKLIGGVAWPCPWPSCNTSPKSLAVFKSSLILGDSCWAFLNCQVGPSDGSQPCFVASASAYSEVTCDLGVSVEINNERSGRNRGGRVKCGCYQRHFNNKKYEALTIKNSGLTNKRWGCHDVTHN